MGGTSFSNKIRKTIEVQDLPKARHGLPYTHLAKVYEFTSSVEIYFW